MSGEIYESMEDFHRLVIFPSEATSPVLQAKYPLIKSCDMPEEIKMDVLDCCLAAAEKFPKDYEKCTQTIKETLDKKTGGPWHVVAGQNFSYDVTHKEWLAHGCTPTPSMHGGYLCQKFDRALKAHLSLQCKTMQYLFLGGTMGILVWKT